MRSLQPEKKFQPQKMKYAKMFPRMRIYEEDIDGVFRADSPMPCHICNHITEYREINSGLALCSEECMVKLDAEIDAFIREDIVFGNQGQDLPLDLPFGI